MYERNPEYCEFRVTANIVLVNGGEYKNVEVLDEDDIGIHIVEEGMKKIIWYDMIEDIAYTLHN